MKTITEMQREEFIRSIDKEKLKEIDLSAFDLNNFKREYNVCLCVILEEKHGVNDCMEYSFFACDDCPLFTKADTIEFLNKEETK